MSDEDDNHDLSLFELEDLQVSAHQRTRLVVAPFEIFKKPDKTPLVSSGAIVQLSAIIDALAMGQDIDLEVRATLPDGQTIHIVQRKDAQG